MTDRPAASPSPDVAGSTTRCGFIAILGAPNAGKSTLINMLVGAKVAIVSRKVQTTRMAIRGIAVEGASQLIFIDTPGIFKPRRRLDRAMVGAAWGAAADAEAIILLVDAVRGAGDELTPILQKLAESKAQRLLVLNKVDSIAEKAVLLPLVAELTATIAFDRVFMISALSGSGVEELKVHLAGVMPEGPWHYPADDLSDVPIRLLAAEITREQIYHWLHEELPYAITVEPAAWKELRDGSVRIEQTIFVERDSQRQIVLGSGGRTIKQISSEARKELGEVLERPVHLFLFVKVREGWENDPERYRELGLEFPRDDG